MAVSDKEAYRILGLPLGADRDAIQMQFKNLSLKLVNKTDNDHRQNLESITAAYNRLIPSKNNKRDNVKKKLIKSSDTENELKFNDEDIPKIEKLKCKKKRKKDKRKCVDSVANINHQNANRFDVSDSDEEDASKENDDEEGLDMNSVFVAALAQKKIPINTSGSVDDSKSNLLKVWDNKNNLIKTKESTTTPEVVKLKARESALKGNKEANGGCFEKAVAHFEEAIKLDPFDHRFYGNRSFCYDQLGHFQEALKDAEKAIQLCPSWPKGYFRKGSALKGLRKLIDAEEAFQKVLELDEHCEEAHLEIIKARRSRVVDMGFSEMEAKAALEKYTTVQAALNALLSGEFKHYKGNVGCLSDDCITSSYVRSIGHSAVDPKMNPQNPGGYTSLWIGNVSAEVTEKMLTRLFNKYGKVISVYIIKDKHCAFANFVDKESTGRAMEALQGYSLCSSKLVLKYPDNAIANGSQNIIKKKSTRSAVLPEHNFEDVDEAVVVPDSECYFWRTTGCIYGDKCRFNHIPCNMGIDKKPCHK